MKASTNGYKSLRLPLCRFVTVKRKLPCLNVFRVYHEKKCPVMKTDTLSVFPCFILGSFQAKAEQWVVLDIPRLTEKPHRPVEKTDEISRSSRRTDKPTDTYDGTAYSQISPQTERDTVDRDRPCEASSKRQRHRAPVDERFKKQHVITCPCTRSRLSEFPCPCGATPDFKFSECRESGQHVKGSGQMDEWSSQNDCLSGTTPVSGSPDLHQPSQVMWRVQTPPSRLSGKRSEPGDSGTESVVTNDLITVCRCTVQTKQNPKAVSASSQRSEPTGMTRITAPGRRFKAEISPSPELAISIESAPVNYQHTPSNDFQACYCCAATVAGSQQAAPSPSATFSSKQAQSVSLQTAVYPDQHATQSQGQDIALQVYYPTHFSYQDQSSQTSVDHQIEGDRPRQKDSVCSPDTKGRMGDFQPADLCQGNLDHSEPSVLSSAECSNTDRHSDSVSRGPQKSDSKSLQHQSSATSRSRKEHADDTRVDSRTSLTTQCSQEMHEASVSAQFSQKRHRRQQDCSSTHSVRDRHRPSQERLPQEAVLSQLGKADVAVQYRHPRLTSSYTPVSTHRHAMSQVSHSDLKKSRSSDLPLKSFNAINPGSKQRLQHGPVCQCNAQYWTGLEFSYPKNISDGQYRPAESCDVQSAEVVRCKPQEYCDPTYTNDIHDEQPSYSNAQGRTPPAANAVCYPPPENHRNGVAPDPCDSLSASVENGRLQPCDSLQSAKDQPGILQNSSDCKATQGKFQRQSESVESPTEHFDAVRCSSTLSQTFTDKQTPPRTYVELQRTGDGPCMSRSTSGTNIVNQKNGRSSDPQDTPDECCKPQSSLKQSDATNRQSGSQDSIDFRNAKEKNHSPHDSVDFRNVTKKEHAPCDSQNFRNATEKTHAPHNSEDFRSATEKNNTPRDSENFKCGTEKDSVVDDSVDFKSATEKGHAWHDSADFRSATEKNHARHDSADFRSATEKGHARRDSADFRSATEEGHARHDSADFRSAAEEKNTALQDSADFRNTTEKDRVSRDSQKFRNTTKKDHTPRHSQNVGSASDKHHAPHHSADFRSTTEKEHELERHYTEDEGFVDPQQSPQQFISHTSHIVCCHPGQTNSLESNVAVTSQASTSQRLIPAVSRSPKEGRSDSRAQTNWHAPEIIETEHHIVSVTRMLPNTANAEQQCFPQTNSPQAEFRHQRNGSGCTVPPESAVDGKSSLRREPEAPQGFVSRGFSNTQHISDSCGTSQQEEKAKPSSTTPVTPGEKCSHCASCILKSLHANVSSSLPVNGGKDVSVQMPLTSDAVVDHGGISFERQYPLSHPSLLTDESCVVPQTGQTLREQYTMPREACDLKSTRSARLIPSTSTKLTKAVREDQQNVFGDSITSHFTTCQWEPCFAQVVHPQIRACTSHGQCDCSVLLDSLNETRTFPASHGAAPPHFSSYFEPVLSKHTKKAQTPDQLFVIGEGLHTQSDLREPQTLLFPFSELSSHSVVQHNVTRLGNYDGNNCWNEKSMTEENKLSSGRHLKPNGQIHAETYLDHSSHNSCTSSDNDDISPLAKSEAGATELVDGVEEVCAATSQCTELSEVSDKMFSNISRHLDKSSISNPESHVPNIFAGESKSHSNRSYNIPRTSKRDASGVFTVDVGTGLQYQVHGFSSSDDSGSEYISRTQLHIQTKGVNNLRAEGSETHAMFSSTDSFKHNTHNVLISSQEKKESFVNPIKHTRQNDKQYQNRRSHPGRCTDKPLEIDSKQVNVNELRQQFNKPDKRSRQAPTKTSPHTKAIRAAQGGTAETGHTKTGEDVVCSDTHIYTRPSVQNSLDRSLTLNPVIPRSEKAVSKAHKKYGQRAMTYSKLPIPRYPYNPFSFQRNRYKQTVEVSQKNTSKYCRLEDSENQAQSSNTEKSEHEDTVGAAIYPDICTSPSPTSEKTELHHHTGHGYSHHVRKVPRLQTHYNSQQQHRQKPLLSPSHDFPRSSSTASPPRKKQAQEYTDGAACQETEWNYKHPPKKVSSLRREFSQHAKKSHQLPLPQYPYYPFPSPDQFCVKQNSTGAPTPVSDVDEEHPETNVPRLRRTYSSDSKKYRKLPVPEHPYYPSTRSPSPFSQVSICGTYTASEKYSPENDISELRRTFSKLWKQHGTNLYQKSPQRRFSSARSQPVAIQRNRSTDVPATESRTDLGSSRETNGKLSSSQSKWKKRSGHSRHQSSRQAVASKPRESDAPAVVSAPETSASAQDRTVLDLKRQFSEQSHNFRKIPLPEWPHYHFSSSLPRQQKGSQRQQSPHTYHKPLNTFHTKEEGTETQLQTGRFVSNSSGSQSSERDVSTLRRKYSDLSRGFKKAPLPQWPYYHWFMPSSSQQRKSVQVQTNKPERTRLVRSQSVQVNTGTSTLKNKRDLRSKSTQAKTDPSDLESEHGSQVETKVSELCKVYSRRPAKVRKVLRSQFVHHANAPSVSQSPLEIESTSTVVYSSDFDSPSPQGRNESGKSNTQKKSVNRVQLNAKLTAPCRLSAQPGPMDDNAQHFCTYQAVQSNTHSDDECLSKHGPVQKARRPEHQFHPVLVQDDETKHQYPFRSYRQTAHQASQTDDPKWPVQHSSGHLPVSKPSLVTPTSSKKKRTATDQQGFALPDNTVIVSLRHQQLSPVPDERSPSERSSSQDGAHFFKIDCKFSPKYTQRLPHDGSMSESRRVLDQPAQRSSTLPLPNRQHVNKHANKPSSAPCRTQPAYQYTGSMNKSLPSRSEEQGSHRFTSSKHESTTGQHSSASTAASGKKTNTEDNISPQNKHIVRALQERLRTVGGKHPLRKQKRNPPADKVSSLCSEFMKKGVRLSGRLVPAPPESSHLVRKVAHDREPSPSRKQYNILASQQIALSKFTPRRPDKGAFSQMPCGRGRSPSAPPFSRTSSAKAGASRGLSSRVLSASCTVSKTTSNKSK